MAEIPEEFTKEIDNKNMAFIPSKSGCKLVFNDLDLSKQEAASILWLLMNGPMLKLEISKVKECQSKEVIDNPV